MESGTTDGVINMTTGAPIEQLAAALFRPTGDPVGDAMSAAIMKNVERIAEMNATGFTTATQFARLANCELANCSYDLQSTGKTGTCYRVVIMRQVGNTYQAAVQVNNPKKVGDSWYKMTLVGDANGMIFARPGW